MEDYRMKLNELLEAIKDDNLPYFTQTTRSIGNYINWPLMIYGRRLDVPGVSLVQRTPLMLAAMFGSIRILEYLLARPGIRVNQRSATDLATALDCAYFYASPNSLHAHHLLVRHGAIHASLPYGSFTGRSYRFCPYSMFCALRRCWMAHNILEFQASCADAELAHNILEFQGPYADAELLQQLNIDLSFLDS